jgi:hypothetical protein
MYYFKCRKTSVVVIFIAFKRDGLSQFHIVSKTSQVLISTTPFIQKLTLNHPVLYRPPLWNNAFEFSFTSRCIDKFRQVTPVVVVPFLGSKTSWNFIWPILFSRQLIVWANTFPNHRKAIVTTDNPNFEWNSSCVYSSLPFQFLRIGNVLLDVFVSKILWVVITCTWLLVTSGTAPMDIWKPE